MAGGCSPPTVLRCGGVMRAEKSESGSGSGVGERRSKGW